MVERVERVERVQRPQTMELPWVYESRSGVGPANYGATIDVRDPL